ncbi:MAG: transcription termination/antitermination protein NusA [Oscillospiraceae bacterium]|nr:transcription termination/antitermination protein NusA [Oscillospiraceae bacterium]
MNADFFFAIEQLEKEKGIPKEYMLDKITQALITAYRQLGDNNTDHVEVQIDEAKKAIRMLVKKEVVEDVFCPSCQISLEEAQTISPQYQLGDVVQTEFKTDQFIRRAAQTARQVIIQGIREAERGIIYDEFTSKEHEVLTGVVTRIDPRSGSASLKIGSGSETTEALLSASEQVHGETLTEGMHLKVYVVEVRKSTRGAQVLLSRTHPGLVKRLFELEVPELYDGIVELKSIAREAGSRTKIAVSSIDPAIDPIGACVGPRGSRVSNVVQELGGEKMDIIKYSEDPAAYIASALSPADVISVSVSAEGKSCRVIVPDDQLSLAIGKEGQNARLAAKLTGYKIDIKPASFQPEEELLQDLSEETEEVEEAKETEGTEGTEEVL